MLSSFSLPHQSYVKSTSTLNFMNFKQSLLEFENILQSNFEQSENYNYLPSLLLSLSLNLTRKTSCNRKIINLPKNINLKHLQSNQILQSNKNLQSVKLCQSNQYFDPNLFSAFFFFSPSPVVCPLLICLEYCQYGTQVNNDGCPTCECNDMPGKFENQSIVWVNSKKKKKKKKNL